MLKQYPMLRYVLQKGFWYLLTFFFAVALNFALPRVGGSDPVDIIMGQAGKGLSPTEAQKKKAELLVSFGMAELDDQGNPIYEPELDSAGNAVTRKVAKLDENEFAVSIIPHTASETTLLSKNVGDIVNLENDIVGKYVKRLLPFGNYDILEKGSLIANENRDEKILNWLSEN